MTLLVGWLAFNAGVLAGAWWVGRRRIETRTLHVLRAWRN